MFVQFMQGNVGDAATLKDQWDTWHRDLAPGASGWLGSTAGIADDGTGFVAARFATAEDAARNAERDEQSAWWRATEACFDGDVEFTDCEDVEVLQGGGSDDAGFVQVIRGRVHNVDEARSFMREIEESGAADRDDVLGGYVGLQADGTFTQVVYFTSEAEAHAGERRAAEEGNDPGEQMARMMDGPPRFLDLNDPWITSP